MLGLSCTSDLQPFVLLGQHGMQEEVAVKTCNLSHSMRDIHHWQVRWQSKLIDWLRGRQ